MLKAPSIFTAFIHAWSDELNHGIPHAHSTLTALILAELVVDVFWFALFHARHVFHVVILEETESLTFATFLGWFWAFTTMSVHHALSAIFAVSLAVFMTLTFHVWVAAV